MKRFIPKKYLENKRNNISIWHNPNENKCTIDNFSLILNKTLNKVEILLNFSPKRKINLCLYCSPEESFNSLGIKIHPSMLTIPYSSMHESLIICHSPEICPENNNKKRVARHILHELAHLFIFEKTNSTRQLGDRMVNLKIPSWLNEGFSEVTTAIVLKRHEIIHKYQKDISSTKENLSEESLEYHLNNFDSQKRNLSFAFATIVVFQWVEKYGINFVFNNLSKIKWGANKSIQLTLLAA